MKTQTIPNARVPTNNPKKFTCNIVWILVFRLHFAVFDKQTKSIVNEILRVHFVLCACCANIWQASVRSTHWLCQWMKSNICLKKWILIVHNVFDKYSHIEMRLPSSQFINTKWHRKISTSIQNPFRTSCFFSPFRLSPSSVFEHVWFSSVSLVRFFIPLRVMNSPSPYECLFDFMSSGVNIVSDFWKETFFFAFHSNFVTGAMGEKRMGNQLGNRPYLIDTVLYENKYARRNAVAKECLQKSGTGIKRVFARRR